MEKAAKFAIAIFCLFYTASLHAQQVLPPLERVVTVELTGQSSKEALQLIENQTGISFGYRTDLVATSDHLQRTYTNKTVRQVLDDIFQGKLTYKEKGDFVLFKEAGIQAEDELLVEGYVFNALNGSKISYVSIYDSTTLTATLSDEYGHYSLALTQRDQIPLSASRYGYLDSTVVLKGSGLVQHNIYLIPLEDSVHLEEDSVQFWSRLERWKWLQLSEEQKATIQNFKTKFKRSAQFSVLPAVGTNGALSPSMTVDYSFNLIGGLNGGVNVVEFGGVFNADWDSVQYAQFAGMFNLVGGPQRGAQFAGFSNINGSTFEGFQASGFSNFTRDKFYGAQATGFANVALHQMDGVQMAGGFNYAGGSSSAVQLAGIANYVHTDSKGTQIAGVSNVAGINFQGVQLSGVANYAMKGFGGTQIGLVNVAGAMTGYQIGLVNITDSIQGVPFGFFSYSRQGLHQLELSANEITQLNLGFKSGTNQFYNSFFAGMRLGGSSIKTWSYGYGIGTSVRAGRKNRVFFDLQTSAIVHDWEFGLSLLNKLTVSYQVQLAPKVAVAIGPSINLFLIDTQHDLDVDYLSKLAPYNFYDETTNSGIRMQSWVGGHVALRLF